MDGSSPGNSKTKPTRVIPQLADTPEVVAKVLAALPNLTVQVLAPNLRGVQNAYHAGVQKISIPVSVSDGHSQANLNRTPAQSIEMMRQTMDWLHAQPRKVPVVVGASTAFGCSIDGVVPTAKTVALCQGLADAGVDEIMLADTVGYAYPAQVKEVVLATRLVPGGAGRLPVCAWGVRQRGDRGSGVPAGEHGVRYGYRHPGPAGGEASAACRTAGRGVAWAGAKAGLPPTFRKAA